MDEGDGVDNVIQMMQRVCLLRESKSEFSRRMKR